jgi:hypothetical protein
MSIHSHTSMAVFVRLSYIGCLRPSECMTLVGQSLVPPIRSQGRTFQSGGILIHDANLGIAGKMGITDEFGMVDKDVWIFSCWLARHDTRSKNTAL